MNNLRYAIPRVGAVVLCVMLVAPASAPAQAPIVAASEEGVTIRPGDLITVSGRYDSLIRLRPRKKGTKYKLTKIPLGVRMKPKGVDHSAYCEKVAVANTFNVVIYDTWSHTVEVLEHDKFGLIADVQWDMACNLIIADMGGDSVGRWPRDGNLWLYTPGGDLRRIAYRQNWVNPTFLDMDEWGTLYIVDKGAEPKMPGTNGQWHFDAIYKVGAPRYTQPQELYKRPGLQVTAFAVQPDGTFLVGNGDVLLLLQKTSVWPLCGGKGFRRINGVDINSDREVFFVDGFDVFQDTFVYRLEDDYTCSLDVLAAGKMVQGAQGLVAGLPRR
jgi:hypothetical protein